ncbi:MAG: T9SS type A sorting domain-containing protein [Bacteroidia bacterium]|nr:T9SS type A sorting domain-containing protein [Bacteroidia bacterium]
MKNYAFFLLLFCVTHLGAQTLNPRGLNPNGTVESYATLGDTVFAVGNFTRVGYQTGAAAWMNDSIPATQFPITDGDVYAILPDGIGGWYIGGLFGTVDTFVRSNLAHILPNGAVDPAFNIAVNNEVRCLALNGSLLYLGGKFTQVGSQPRNYLARLNVAGGSVSLNNWTPNPDSYVYSLSSTSGELYVGGSFSLIQGVNQPAFAVFNHATGSLQQSLTPGTGQVTTLARDGNKLYAGGTFLGNTGYYTGKGALLPLSSTKPQFSFPRFGGTVYALISDGAGGWYAGGAFTQVNDQPSGRLIHILPNLTLDPAFAPAPNGVVYALHLQGDTLYAGGTFTTIAAQPRNNLAAFKTTTNGLLNWQPDPTGKVTFITADNSRVFIGGTFIRVSGEQHPRFAVVNRTTGKPAVTPVPESGEVFSILTTTAGGGHIYAGGNFSGSVGYSAQKAALLSASAETSPPKLPDFNGDIQAAISDGAGGWYVSGAFTQANGLAISRLAHILSDTTLDNTFSFTVNNAISALALSGNTLYIGGLFSTINGNTRNALAAIDISSKTLLPWNPDANGQVNAMIYQGGQVYIGGNFTSVGGQTRNRLAAVDGVSAAVSAWNPDVSNVVNDLLYSGGQIYVGGNFTTIGGQTRNRLAAINATTGAVSSWDPNVNSTVNTLALSSNNTLYIGGIFTMVGGQTRTRLAEVNITGGTVTSFNPNVNGTVEDITLMGGQLYAGGSFTQVGGQNVSRLAAINPTTGLPASWLPSPNSTVICMAVSGSSLFVGGNFEVLKTETRTRLMDIQPTTYTLQPWAPNLNNSVNDLVLYQSDLIAGGAFTLADGQTRNRLARWNINTQTLVTWSPGADDVVNTLALRNDTVFAGGEFMTLSGAARGRVGALSVTNGAALSWSPDADNPVLSLAISGSTLAVGGTFDKFLSEERNRLFCLDISADTLTPWAPDLPGILFGPRVNALAVSGDSVWVGGYFGALGGITRNNLALTDGQTGQILTPTADTEGEVFALHVLGDDLWVGGQLLDSVNHVARENAAVLNRHTGAVRSLDPGVDNYVFTITSGSNLVALGGRFDQVRSQRRGGGFALENSTGRLLDWNPNKGINSFIYTIALDPRQGHAYLGGYFSSLHDQPRQNLARVNLTDGQPDSWQADADQFVTQLIWDAKAERLLVAGNFFNLTGQPRRYLGAVDAAGQLLPFNPSPDLDISAIALYDTTLYVAGTFTEIAGQPRAGLAALGAAGQPLPWEPQVSSSSGLGRVYALTVGSGRLYIGGWFVAVNGESHYRLAAFDLRNGELLPWDPAVDVNFTTSLRRVNRIREINNNLFVMGPIADVNGTAVSGIAWMDPASGLVKGLRIIPGGLVFDVAAIDSLLYIGGNFIHINQAPYLYQASFTFPPDFFSEGYAGIVPEMGGNTGDLTVNIYGGGFKAGVQVILRKAGFPDIVAFDSLTAVLSGIQIRATFNLRTQQPGLRDVLLVMEGDTTVIPDGFEIISGGESRVWADIIMPSNMRIPAPNRTNQYTVMISYGNSGTIDAEGVPIWVAVDTSFTVVGFDFEWIPQVPEAGNPADSGLYAVQVDTVLGDAFGANVYVMIVPRVPAGFQGYLGMYVSPKHTGTAYIEAWATDPLYGSPLKYAVGECMDLLIGKFVGVIPGGDCVYNALDALLSPMFDAAYDHDNFGSAKYLSSYSLTLANAIVECGILATGGGLVLDILSDILSYANFVNDINTILSSCLPLHPNPKPNPNGSKILGSMDPNQKSGVGGAGSQRWISQDDLMPYLIEFENVDSASAPAQVVVILDTLDASVYDLNTLKLNFFTISDSIFSIPNGRNQWTSWVDLRPRVNSLVHVEAGLTGNVLRWEFESLDPATLAPQSGVLEGFLPPNVNDPEGRGSVSYTVQRLENLPTFTALENRAAIYFDSNAPILTNTWTNTLDVDQPESQMEALDTLQVTTKIPLKWSGSDIGSGVWYYRLMVSENGEPYKTAADFLTDTTAIFSGNWGYTYQFYTLAVDSAGNIESAPDTADATTHVYGGLSIPEPRITDLSLYPNPNDGTFTLEAEVKTGQMAGLHILDLAGRVVYRETVRMEVGQNRILLSPHLPAGTYFLILERQGETARIRFSIL